MLNYIIITENRVNKSANPEILYLEQEQKAKELGLDTSFSGKEINVHFFNSRFFDESYNEMNIYDALENLAIKDGVDLVQYENGNYGYVAYYNGNRNGFEILKEDAA